MFERITVTFPEHVHIHLHCDAGVLNEEILNQLKELKVMSQTNQEKVDAANAALAATMDKIQTDVGEIASDLQAAIPAPGTIPSQESLDTLNAGVARLQGIETALANLGTLNPGQTPAPPAEPQP